MIFLAGSFFWLLSLLAIVRLLCITHESFLGPRARLYAWCVLLLMAVCLLFRPHEDIFGGEDPGSYINSGITYGRKNAFFYADPLLSLVPEQARHLFYYGHAGYGTTKDVCLWVRNPEEAVVGPHFQPAYPLLISVLTRIGGAQLALYVIPLFTLFTALALRSLALQCIRHRMAGVIAFLFYILNPLTLWHGRCARPEIIAAFLFFGGSAMLLHAWQKRCWSHWYDIIIGTLCVCFAPFFHITAFLLVIPAVLVVAVVITHARDDFFLFPVCASAVFMAFVYQIKNVTDYYKVGRFIDKALAMPMLAGMIAFICLLVLAAICFIALRFRKHGKPVQTVPLFLCAILAVVTTAFFIVSYMTRDPAGSLPILGRPVRNYLYLTDLRAFVNMVSKPMAFLMLAGWATWLTGHKQYRRQRVVFALTIFPGIMLAGNIHDFMMTRYLHVAIIPAAALSLTALVTLLPDRRWSSGFAVALTAAICLLGLHHKSHLMTFTEHKGLTRFLKPYAKIIARDNGILLCEYSRLAAPFEHFFGIPTLGLDNERRTDYSEAEKAWANIMRACSNQPAFFMTPFQRPLSDRFRFKTVYSSVFKDQRLQQAYQYLPTRVRTVPVHLALYKMTLKTPSEQAPLLRKKQYVVPFDAGNMGLRRFANLRIKSWPIDGIELPAEESAVFNLPQLPDDTEAHEIFLFLMAKGENPSEPIVSLIYSSTGDRLMNRSPEGLRCERLAALVLRASAFGGSASGGNLEPFRQAQGPEPVEGQATQSGARRNQVSDAAEKIVADGQFIHLADNWWLFRIKASQLPAGDKLAVKARSDMFLADMMVLTDSRVFHVLAQFPESRLTRRDMSPIKARWARASAQALLPVPCGGKGIILMLLYPPEASPDMLTHFALGNNPLFSANDREMPEGKWQWQAWPFNISTVKNDAIWLKLETRPAWNPETRGFPTDLGVLIGYIIVLPE